MTTHHCQIVKLQNEHTFMCMICSRVNRIGITRLDSVYQTYSAARLMPGLRELVVSDNDLVWEPVHIGLVIVGTSLPDQRTNSN